MKKTLQAAVILVLGIHAHAQGTFQNLNFEQANPVSAGNGLYTTASALPGWSVYYGTVSQPQLGENLVPLSTTTVSLWTAAGPVGAGGGDNLDGNYSVFMLGGEVMNEGGLTPESASISQTALIPAGTQALLFKAQQDGPGPLDVDIGTQNVSLTAVGIGPNYLIYGANISAWAGQTEELTFLAPASATEQSGWVIDDISFSPNAVPEPTSFTLIGIGGLVFAGYRRVALKWWRSLGT